MMSKRPSAVHLLNCSTCNSRVATRERRGGSWHLSPGHGLAPDQFDHVRGGYAAGGAAAVRCPHCGAAVVEYCAFHDHPGPDCRRPPELER